MYSASTSSSPVARASGPRPDPEAGVFETLLVVDGRPLELDAHLARLDDSLRALFGSGTPRDARALVLDRARGHGLARLRLTVAPDGLGAAVHEVTLAPVDPALVLPDPERAIELAPVVVAGGIGAHKWADRRLLAAADADAAPRVPLLLDRDGAVLEASRGNLFAVYDGVLVTPPVDGRILPGVTRGRVLRLAAELRIPRREEPLAFDRLSAADELFLTGAVRGIEPVRACDGAFTGSDHQTTAKLAHALRRSWECEK